MTGFCECGCGAATRPARQSDSKRGYVKGQPYRFVPGHNQRLKRRTDGGYFAVYAPQTIAGTKTVHSLIAERALGRPLPRGAEVHHVDGNRQNNAHANLVICQDKAYHKLLHVRARIVRAGGNPNTEKICCACQRLKALGEFNQRRAHSTGRQNICRDCSKAAFAAWHAKRAERVA